MLDKITYSRSCIVILSPTKNEVVDIISLNSPGYFSRILEPFGFIRPDFVIKFTAFNLFNINNNMNSVRKGDNNEN